MLSIFRSLLVVGGLVMLGGSSLFAQERNPGAGSKLDAALETAAETGRPVLIVGARDTCGLCQSFLAELQSDLRARAATSQFVSLKLDVDAAEWRDAARKYPYKGGLLPIIMIVRADGEQLYGNAGAPPQPAPFLFEHLKKARTVLPPRQLDQLRDSAARAQELVTAGKIDQAVNLMKRHLDSGSYAAPAVQLKTLAEELSATAKEAFETADKAMSSEEPTFEAALAFAEVGRLYGELPEVGAAIKDKEKEYRKNPAWVDLLNQAELFSKGQAYAADEKHRQALGVFQSLLQKYPNTPAAKKAGEEIAKLDSEAETPASSAQSTPAADSEDLKRAASYLRFGKTFQGKDAEKARKYFEKVIETAPESDLAAEARQLIEKLP